MADYSNLSGDPSQSEDAPVRDDKKFLADVQARFKLVEEAENENRRDALDDLKFAAGEQWDPAVEAARKADRRPCFTINRLPQHIKQVTNDQRQNRPAIKVHPVDDNADVETAKILSGLIRHIEYNSNADAAYDTGFEGAVRGGRGYWRIITDYLSPTSFDQEILIKRIRNPFSVFFDPYSKEPDGSDANYAFVTEDLSKEEYVARYPDSKLAQQGEWESVGNAAPGWMGETSARIAEYFYKDTRAETIHLLTTGQVVLEKDLKQVLEAGALAGMPVDVARSRKTLVPAIKWCKLNACEILEETDWPGSYIPIVPVFGEELDIDGKRILRGIVRDAKDPQRLINYWKSAEAETIALAPKAPWIAEEGQLAGYEADWAAANERNFAFLKYKSKSVNGVPLPPPSRQVFEPAVGAITQAAMMAVDDLKATTGIYDASLGNKSNETSGIAIQRRNVQAQTSNFHFVDNLTRSLKHTGRIVIELIPMIYDTARTERIIGEDGTADVIKLNQPFEKDGKLTQYDLSAGKYDVTVDVGPSFASKRQEAAASMLDLAKSLPALQQAAPDLIVKNMDWPGAQDIADRLKKTLPQGLADDPKGQNQPLPPQIQAQMAQMSQMIDQLTKQLNTAHDALDKDLVKIESNERIEFAKLKSNETIELAKIDAKDSIALLNAEIASIENRLGLLHNTQALEPQDSQSFAPSPSGAPVGAEMGMQGSDEPTGGASPGLPMDENS